MKKNCIKICAILPLLFLLAFRSASQTPAQVKPGVKPEVVADTSQWVKKNPYDYNYNQGALNTLPEAKRKTFDSLYAAMSSTRYPAKAKIRNPAEWEEMSGILVAWLGYPSVQREIIRHAQKEGKVNVVCTDSVGLKNYLKAYNIPLTNVRFLNFKNDYAWARDYGGNFVYLNEVDSLAIVDWHYNRKKPLADVMALHLGKKMNRPVFSTVGKENDLISTGGNYMSDGFGTAFSSKLILKENPDKTEKQIDILMKKTMGINRYIKMDILPYDGIHHIDMHIKLLDEETLLVSEYPAGVSDGPQIEKNLKYILDNYKSVFGTPYKVVRIPAPPHEDTEKVKRWVGGYRGQQPDSVKRVPNYRTYTNSLILNKTVMVPLFEFPKYDTMALNIYKKAMPGYNIVGYDCNASIDNGGAIHCLTHEIAVADPLLISHQQLASQGDKNKDLKIEALVKHRSGIQAAQIFYRTGPDQSFKSVPMKLKDAKKGTWTGNIPPQAKGTVLNYYIYAKAKSGKEQFRPMPAPEGYWTYKVEFDMKGAPVQAASLN